MRLGGNEYSLRELAGAFGDLGTLVPFVVGYLTVSRMDPAGVLVAFGLFKIAAGLYYRTPMPVQPMKAIGAAAFSHGVTPGAIWASGLFSGAFWLILGLTGVAARMARLAGRPVVQGLVLGLGLGLMLESTRMIASDPGIGFVAAALTLVLLGRSPVAAMLALLGFGMVVGLTREPGLLNDVVALGWRWRAPHVQLGGLDWPDVVTGIVVLGLPQAALTFGNAIIATVEENNALFPDRRVTVRGIAVDHGIMNLVSSGLGGAPLCHGAGGMAGHVRFGARTGGALVMLGVLLLAAGLFLSDSIHMLLRLFPTPVLGVILFAGALELAAGVALDARARAERYVTLLTAAVAVWNVGAGFLAGLVVWHAWRRGWLGASGEEETSEDQRA